ncbi:alpha/beta hydrolase [Hymenobacter sp. BT523]|uniref:alpha/beta hydrolase n=1 Tax=Hymenobacter sp. BT523 TaxID=2795725 RepID=UPI0018ED4779|nr:alpha/beta hydrolase [Hymenobacter sp. BT523]MBJ6111685.1 alpha/beta hydrolase [Hymenobacter sp. BT523]
MPSFQHLLLKQFLTAAAAPLARRKPSVGAMRLAMEAGSLFQFMPWHVHMDSLKLDNRLEAEWLRPRGAHPTRVLLYLHGGGYVLGSLNTHRSLVGSLAQRSGLNVLTINYRKAPDHPFPAALDDAKRAYRWLLRHGHQPHDIAVAGDSAGGGLALALLLALRNAGEALPAAGVGLSPWTDLNLPITALRRVAREEGLLLEALQMRTWGPLYARKTPLTHPLLSPLQADLHGLPPLLIQVSTAEVLYDDALRFADKARAAGVPVTLQPFDGLVHWWHLFWRIVPEARQALDQVASFLEKTWAAPEAENSATGGRSRTLRPQPRRRLAA